MDELNLNEQEPEQETPVVEEVLVAGEIPEAPAADMPEPAEAEPIVPPVPDPAEIDDTKPIVPKRERRKSKQQIFKETYLPFVIMGVSLLLCISFIFGSVGLSRERAALKDQEERIAELLKTEAEELKAKAALLAAEILAVSDDALAAKLDAKRVSDAQAVLKKDAALQAELNK